MINDFEFYSPTRIVFGRGTEKRTGEQVRAFGGKRALIVYGTDRVLKNGLMDAVTQSLKDAGVEYASLGGVVPNPLLSKVYEGIELGKKQKTDFLLAVGGGSVIDTAKAIAYGLAEQDKDVWELFAHTRNAKACLPVGCVLTIAAAGSEMSTGSVITKDETAEKRAYDDDLARPRFTVMDPELTMTLSDYQTECGCADMMMHTMERYFTSGGNMELTDGMAEALMRTVMKYALVLHADPKNYEARAEIMWAGSLAHNNLTGLGSVGGDFATHMMEHEIGGMFHVTHGAGLTAIWGSWARYVYKECLPRFVKYALNVHGVTPGATDEETAIKGIEAQEAFYRAIGMPVSMKELGVEPTEEQMREMAQRCCTAVGGQIGSAKALREDDMFEIYKAAR